MNRERAALLKCRYAGRYDGTTVPRIANDPDAAEEQEAALTSVPVAVWRDLLKRQLVSRAPLGGMRLTKLGEIALQKIT